MTVKNENEIIKNLLDLAHAVFVALDDSEEGCGDDGRMHIIDSANFDSVCTALDRLEELPDDQPGYTMDAPGKAKWALRHLLTVTSAQPPQSCGEDAADQADGAVKELQNILNAKRFDRETFANDTEFADWAQSRARHTLARAAYLQSTATQPPVSLPHFPTVLRKMWSGGEVQAWLDEHVAPLIAENAYIAKRLSESLADVYVTICGEDTPDADDSINAIERVKKAARVLRLEVDLHRAAAKEADRDA